MLIVITATRYHRERLADTVDSWKASMYRESSCRMVLHKDIRSMAVMRFKLVSVEAIDKK